MTDGDDLRTDLAADVEPEEARALLGVADRLRTQRPVPAAAFRGDLRRRLVAEQGGRSAPARLLLMVAASGASGVALLLFATASVAGLGPLAA